MEYVETSELLLPDAQLIPNSPTTYTTYTNCQETVKDEGHVFVGDCLVINNKRRETKLTGVAALREL
jgi:hypothetical protein